MSEIEIVTPSNVEKALELLQKDPIANGLAIQDLRRWPEQSKFYFTDQPFSYLHVSGHPAHVGSTIIVLGGEPTVTHELFAHVKPQAPFTVRETSAAYQAAVEHYYPAVKVYEEYRMDVTLQTFKPHHKGTERQLTEADAPALAKFHGAPPQAVARFIGWVKGARALHAVFDGETIVAIGSSFVSTPDTWNLVGIATHENHRGRGHGTAVTSSLVERALSETKTVTVTVVKDNVPAIKTYEKLGFRIAEERIWADCGANSKP
ncbi:MAG: GNAT family N-acetyltransferase [Bdellovibrionota bacterium]